MQLETLDQPGARTQSTHVVDIHQPPACQHVEPVEQLADAAKQGRTQALRFLLRPVADDTVANLLVPECHQAIEQVVYAHRRPRRRLLPFQQFDQQHVEPGGAREVPPALALQELFDRLEARLPLASQLRHEFAHKVPPVAQRRPSQFLRDGLILPGLARVNHDRRRRQKLERRFPEIVGGQVTLGLAVLTAPVKLRQGHRQTLNQGFVAGNLLGHVGAP